MTGSERLVEHRDQASHAPIIRIIHNTKHSTIHTVILITRVCLLTTEQPPGVKADNDSSPGGGGKRTSNHSFLQFFTIIIFLFCIFPSARRGATHSLMFTVFNICPSPVLSTPVPSIFSSLAGFTKHKNINSNKNIHSNYNNFPFFRREQHAPALDKDHTPCSHKHFLLNT